MLDDLGRPEEDANFPRDDYEVGVNFKPYEEVEDWGIQNQTRWQINDDMELVSITAYREYQVERGQDIDFSGADLLQPQYVNEKFENFSQEFQFTWSTERVDFLFGAYFYTEDIVSDESIRIGSQGPEYLSRYILGRLDGGTGVLLSTVNQSLGAGQAYTSNNGYNLEYPMVTEMVSMASGMTTMVTTTVTVTSTYEGPGSWDNATQSYVKNDNLRPNYQNGDGYMADYFQETQGWSVFTREVIRLGDKWDMTLGLRYSNETKEAETWINGVAPIEGETERELLTRMLNNEFNEAHCTGFIFIGSTCNIVSWHDEETEKEWSGTATLSYQWTDNTNIFFSYSRGYKAGGFNLDQQAIEMDSFATYLATGGQPFFLLENPADRTAANIDMLPQRAQDQSNRDDADGNPVPATNGNVDEANGITCGLGPPAVAGGSSPARRGVAILDCAYFDDDHAFLPEFVDSYELGIKSELMDGDLIANIAIFYSDFEDFQLNTFTGTGFLISNTNQMISKGVELETTWFLSDNLLWTFGVTYADARYGDNLNAETTPLQLWLDQEYDALEDWQALENIEGRQITHAPYWQGSTSLFFQTEIGSVIGYGNLNLGYRGAHNTGSNLENEKDESDKALLNVQLGLRMPDDSWDLQLWARNLADKQIDTLVFNSVFQDGSYSTFLNPPRMIGITLLTNW